MKENYFLKKISDAFNNLDIASLNEVFSDNIIFHSVYLNSPISTKEKVIDYFQQKFQMNKKLNVEIIAVPQMDQRVVILSQRTDKYSLYSALLLINYNDLIDEFVNIKIVP